VQQGVATALLLNQISLSPLVYTWVIIVFKPRFTRKKNQLKCRKEWLPYCYTKVIKMKLFIALIIVSIATLIVSYKEYDDEEGDYLNGITKEEKNKIKIMEDALDAFDESIESDDNKNTKKKDPIDWSWGRKWSNRILRRRRRG